MESMPVLLLFVITMSACLIGSLLRAWYGKNTPQSTAGYHLFNAASSLFCALLLLVLGGAQRPSLFTLLLGIGFGIAVAGNLIANTAALAIGPISYTSLIISLSTVITALSGALFWHETLRLTQIIGILLMVVCLILSVKKDEGEGKAKTVRWFLLSVIACLFNGAIGILQKVHQSSAHRDELMAFLAVSFGFSFLFSTVCLLFSLRGGKKEALRLPSVPDKKKALLLLAVFAVVGICTALNHVINLYLAGIVESAVFFPIVNGGGLILLTLSSFILFHEKLTRRQTIGLLVGFAAVLLLCL